MEYWEGPGVLVGFGAIMGGLFNDSLLILNHVLLTLNWFRISYTDWAKINLERIGFLIFGFLRLLTGILAVSMRSGMQFCATWTKFQLKRTILDIFREKSKLGLGRPDKHLKSNHKSILEACFDPRECLESIQHVGDINFVNLDAPNDLMATHFVTHLR